MTKVLFVFIFGLAAACGQVPNRSSQDTTANNGTNTQVYPYHCGIYSSMKGTVTVTNADTNATIDVMVNVIMSNSAFMPSNVIVPHGGQVQWSNADTISHSVVADDGSFNLQQMLPGYKGHLCF